MEAAGVPIIDEWIKDLGVVHLHNGILRSRKKERTLTFVTAGTDLDIIMLSEISQSVEDKYHTISLICGI